MNPFLKNYLDSFYRPSTAFRSVLKGNHFRNGFLYMLIPLTLYTLMYVFLAIGKGAPSTFTPWLNISREHYYFYNQFLVAPSMVLAWFVAAAYVQVVSRALHGQGTFESTLSLLGLSISVAMWTTLLHDLAMSFSSAIQLIDAKEHEIAMNSPTVWRTILWIYMGAYMIAFPALYYRVVRTVHRLNKTKSFVVGLTAFILFQLIFLVFNR